MLLNTEGGDDADEVEYARLPAVDQCGNSREEEQMRHTDMGVDLAIIDTHADRDLVGSRTAAGRYPTLSDDDEDGTVIEVIAVLSEVAAASATRSGSAGSNPSSEMTERFSNKKRSVAIVESSDEDDDVVVATHLEIQGCAGLGIAAAVAPSAQSVPSTANHFGGDRSSMHAVGDASMHAVGDSSMHAVGDSSMQAVGDASMHAVGDSSMHAVADSVDPEQLHEGRAPLFAPGLFEPSGCELKLSDSDDSGDDDLVPFGGL
jgi:hypothetical protein